jgi:hypothetical protein
MKRHKEPRPLFSQFIADCEERITRQHQLITELKQQRLPTAGAIADLKKEEATLRQLKSHAAVMRFLLESSARTRRQA